MPRAEQGTPRTGWAPRHRRPGIAWLAGVVGLATLVGTVGDWGAWWFPRQETPVPAATASAEPSPDPGAAIRVSVVISGLGTADCPRQGHLLAGGIAQLQAPPRPARNEDRVGDWLAARGSIPVLDFVEFTVESVRSSAAVVTGMRAVVDRRSPTTGAVMVVTGECGGSMPQRPFTVDLTGTAATVAAQPDTTAPDQPPQPFPFKVSETDPEYFAVKVPGVTGDVDWHLELSWTLAGTNHLTRIPTGTDTFRTTDAPVHCAPSLPDLVANPKRC